ncbi:MAG: PA14 domain-containing protein [Verrucomicrobiales bacterium]|nr:PA14 domain-containing protein [Verrucomicrobiales bacterium]MDP5005675.1 PA14 domain-containing protein [Verrucomicrobiales bacterium]
MLFLNTVLLLGALGIAIPIVIHLLNRRSSRVVDWGAMGFLLESLAIRNRRIQLEEALLMATRCLLVGLLALALARPFIPPGSTIPWLLILPLLLFAVVGIGVAVVLHDEPKWRRWIAGISIGLLLACVALIVFEKYLNLSRFTPGARQDIALIIDGSTSMGITVDGMTNFERAIEEARTLIKRAPRGHAFSLILGGPSPGARVLDPTTDRAVLEASLDEMAPLDGAMTTYQAFTLASLSLARGDNPAKQIVIMTDEQNVGWEIGQSGRWNFLRDAFRNLPSEPQIMIRKMPLPDFIRNLAVTDVRLSREIVGVDRPVNVAVTVANTGNEAVTPGALVMTVDDGRDYRDSSVGQLRPGEEQTIFFTHQFGEAGAHSLSLTLEVEDDIESDNTGVSAVNVASELRVLIVDGRPADRAFESASAFAAVALAPSALTLDPELEANVASVSDEASDDFNRDYDPTRDLIRFLIDPQVLPLPDIATISDFTDFDTIILADVPRLPAAVAASLAKYVSDGGGLLVAAGQKSQPDFFNGWKTADEASFLPATLGEVTFAPAGQAFSPSARTLAHPALQKIADTSKSDFAGTLISNFRPQTIPDTLTKESSVGARLNNGDILLSSRRVGRGQVLLLGIPLDLSSGNLVTRQAFLPLIHELVYHLADPAAYQLNLEPGWEVNIGLTGKRGRAIGEGLIGRYYASHNATEPSFTRQDEAINFNWLNGVPAPGIPADNFRVEWAGKIQLPDPKNLNFKIEVDDAFEFWIDGKQVGQFNGPGGDRRLSGKFEANRWYDFRAVFRENTGEAKAMMRWEGDGLPNQIIPPARFRSFSGGDELTGRESGLTSFAVRGPNDRPRSAQLSSLDGGSVLKLQGDISSGLYHLTVPDEQAPFFAAFLRPGSKEIPFTVKRDAAESRLVRLSDADYAFLANFVTLSSPQTLEELIGFLNGNQFGQELWKYLALGAFVFLLIEIVLSRWIAQSRRMGEEIKIQFESKDAPTNSFREQLARFGKT